MKSLARLTFLAILCLSGCVRSLHPLYAEKDLVFDDHLLGAWINAWDGKDTWDFQRAGENAYTLSILTRHARGDTADASASQRTDTSWFDAHLVRLGPSSFLDLFPRKPATGMEYDYYALHFVRVHTFLRIWLEGDTVRFSVFDNDWLKRMLEEKKVSIAHEVVDKGLLLTAPTRDIQELVMKYADDRRAFPNPEPFRRVR